MDFEILPAIGPGTRKVTGSVRDLVLAIPYFMHSGLIPPRNVLNAVLADFCARNQLAANLVASYEGGQPDLMTVILNSHGFGNLLENMSFMARVAHQDSRIVGLTRTARAAVAKQATQLEGLEARLEMAIHA